MFVRVWQGGASFETNVIHLWGLFTRREKKKNMLDTVFRSSDPGAFLGSLGARAEDVINKIRTKAA